MLFQSCFSLKQSCSRAVQGCFPLIQRCSALVKIRHILVWNSKNTLINTTFALFSIHFLLKTLFFSLFTILQGTCDQEAWGRGGCVNSNFWLEFRRNDFFHSWYTPKEHVFRDPNTFSNLHEAFSSVSHFVLIQRWTALIQRKPALSSSETALISAGFLNPFWNSADQRWNFWNLWNSAVQRWFALGLQPGKGSLIIQRVYVRLRMVESFKPISAPSMNEILYQLPYVYQLDALWLGVFPTVLHALIRGHSQWQQSRSE